MCQQSDTLTGSLVNVSMTGRRQRVCMSGVHCSYIQLYMQFVNERMCRKHTEKGQVGFSKQGDPHAVCNVMLVTRASKWESPTEG